MAGSLPPRTDAASASPVHRRVTTICAAVGWIVLILLLVFAARVRFSIAPVAISEWDSWGWLKPALGWIGGQGFVEEYEREWLYGAFIAGCLKLTGSFAGYVVIQRLLGLLAAVVMWVTWRCWIGLFPRSLVLEIGSTWAGLSVIALYLFNPISRSVEMAIRPEAIMPLVAMGQLLCVVAYCRFRWHEPRAWPAVLTGAGAILLAAAMYVLKPNWLLAVPLTTFPVLVGLWGTGLPRATRFGTPVLGGLLVVLLLWLPDKLFFQRSAQVRVVLPMTLFTIHADIIRASLAAEMDDTGTPPERRRFLDNFLPLLDREMVNARNEKPYYPRLGFDPDYLMYRATLFPTLRETEGMSQQDLAAFCKASFLSALSREPDLYLAKVGRQMDYFLLPDAGTFYRKRIELARIYEYVLSTLRVEPDPTWNPSTQAIFQTYLDAVAARQGTQDRLETAKADRQFFERIRLAAPWLCGLFLVCLGATFCGDAFSRWRLPGLVALIFYAAPAGNALTVAMVHALDNARYRGSYGPLLVFALAAMGVFSVCILACAARLAYRRIRRA